MGTMWLLLALASTVQAIKFMREGVLVPDNVLSVGEGKEVECKYIMWRQERLYSVTWSIQYSGVKTDFFVYQEGGSKEVKPGVSLVTVDADNSEDKVVKMRLTDGREEEVTICCDVMVLRDDGYGSMTNKHKEKCSDPIRVEDSGRGGQALVSASMEAPSSGSVGSSLPLVCSGGGLTSWHSLELMVNGERLRSLRGGRLEYTLPLTERHFTRGYYQEETMSVGCLVMKSGQVVANDTRTIRKEEQVARLGSQGSHGSQGSQGSQSQSRGDRGLFSTAEGQSSTGHCHSYMVLEETRRGSLLRGRIPAVVMEGLTHPARLSEDRHETSMSAVLVLDVLGFHGYRVAAAATQPGGQAWTLERRCHGG